MARLKAGVPPTPIKIRQAAYRDDLLARGGHRLIVHLEPPANDALRKIMAREVPPKSQKDAVSEALVEYARAKPRKVSGG